MQKEKWGYGSFKRMRSNRVSLSNWFKYTFNDTGKMSNDQPHAIESWGHTLFMLKFDFLCFSKSFVTEAWK